MPLGIAQDDPESILTLARTGSGGRHPRHDRRRLGRRIRSRRVGAQIRGARTRFLEDRHAAREAAASLAGWASKGCSACRETRSRRSSARECFSCPCSASCSGLLKRRRPLPEAVLGAALPANGPREHYMRARSEWREDGARVVTPLPSQDSSLVAALARADCLIVRAPDAPALPQGAARQDHAARPRLRRRKPESRELSAWLPWARPPASWGVNSCGTQTEQINCS